MGLGCSVFRVSGLGINFIQVVPEQQPGRVQARDGQHHVVAGACHLTSFGRPEPEP